MLRSDCDEEALSLFIRTRLRQWAKDNDLVEKADDGRVYLSGYDEFDRHSIVLREADAPGVDFMAFKVAGDADLETFEKRIEDFGLAVDRVAPGEQPGVGRRHDFLEVL